MTKLLYIFQLSVPLILISNVTENYSRVSCDNPRSIYPMRSNHKQIDLSFNSLNLIKLLNMIYQILLPWKKLFPLIKLWKNGYRKNKSIVTLWMSQGLLYTKKIILKTRKNVVNKRIRSIANKFVKSVDNFHHKMANLQF